MKIDEYNKTLENDKIFYILVYGEHRRTQKDFSRIKSILGESVDALKYLETVKVTGYKMYDNGIDPVCEYTGNKTDTIVCDVLKVNKVGFRIIDNSFKSLNLERNIVFNKEINKSIEYLLIYLVPNSMEISNFTRIINGDWVNYSIRSGFD